LKTLIFGFLKLVIIYRDHLNGLSIPLMPWLHSTEVVERVFGICRQLIKDFTMLDFIFMVPKLFILLREHVFLVNSANGKARAAGYSHTYADNRSLDTKQLSILPTDAELEEAAAVGYGEADSLFALLGVSIADLKHRASRPDAIVLPSIKSWLDYVPVDGTNMYTDEDDQESNTSSTEVDPADVSAQEKPDSSTSTHAESGVQELIDEVESFDPPNAADKTHNSRLNSIRSAAVAMLVEQENALYVNLFNWATILAFVA
jgi:hypothetical protein